VSLFPILLVAVQPAAIIASGTTEPAQADVVSAPAETPLSDAIVIAPAPARNVAAAPQATIPKLTPIAIEVLQPLGSKLSTTGDLFPIRLASPILVDGVEVIAAGTPGMGEVIHAKKSGGMGAAGELVITARYLEFDGRRLPLRSMHLIDASTSGKSKIDTVNAIAMGSAATIPALSFIGLFIDGGQVNVAQGALAEAKTAEDFALGGEPAQTATAPGAAAPEQGNGAGDTPVAEPQPTADANLSMEPIIREGNDE